ncbi:hypothetical protein BDQ17DRAFT_1354300 [Cyathus striatus]|nr:hypothetical protein BDQ17DRAFT_1354300 [Cyathus striatus]
MQRSHAILARSFVQSRTLTRPSQRLLGRRILSTTPIRSSESSSAPPPAPEQPEPPRESRWKNFLQILGRTTLITIIAGTGTFYYVTQREKHPGVQEPFDPSKKTIVVLGSGWGATSLLKNIDNEQYNIVVISPKNFFLFTPLLPSVAVGTLSPTSLRAVFLCINSLSRRPSRSKVRSSHPRRVFTPRDGNFFSLDNSEIKGAISSRTIPYDYLVYAVGAEVQTFNIPGVKEHACFMKELQDAEKMQRRFMDCIETAAFPGQDTAEIDRLLHMVVVGGGPTGIEVSGELHDFLEDDLRSWYPELASRVKITLVEALPSVLPMFSKQLIDYTESTFKESKIDILTKTMVKEVKENSVVLQMPDKTVVEVPCGLVVWAAGNKGRKITQDLMAKLSDVQNNRRGISVDDYLRMKGAEDSIFAIGDCTATSYAPTAQVASQQGAYLARLLQQIAKRDKLQEELVAAQRAAAIASDEEGKKKAISDAQSLQSQVAKVKLRPFQYSHQGSLAYIGSDKAIADLPFMNGNFASGGVATYLFWRSAYLSTLFSLRNRTLVATDWLKVKLFGRDVSRD